jgi:hypothetical protein
MVNLPRRFTGLPMVVWCSPANAPHDIRVKVSPVHGDRMIADQAVTIAVRPQPNYPDDERRRLSAADFALVARWVRRNQDLLLLYWHSQIDTNEFRRRIAERLANPEQECS